MMKTIFVSGAILFFSVVPYASAADGFVALAPIPGLTQGVTADTAGLAAFFNNLYKYAIGMASVLAIIMIIWGGLQYATQDIPGAKQEGKDRILQAILGLILVLSPVLVFSIINPSILNLSINLKPLDTKTGATGTGSGTGTQKPATTDPTTGCTVSGTFFKKASCPNPGAAQSFVATCEGTGKIATCQTETSSGCADKTIMATCSGKPAGPYIFIDVSNAYIPLSLFSDYQPLVSSNANQNNGTEAVQFAAQCSQDGGMTCLSGSTFKVPCTYSTAQATSQSNKCYSATVTCEESSFVNKLSICGSSPSWNPIK